MLINPATSKGRSEKDEKINLLLNQIVVNRELTPWYFDLCAECRPYTG